MYFVYLDESGDSRFRENVREESNFFLLGGFIVKERNLLDVNNKFIQFKKENLPKELHDYPIHAVELNHISKHKKTKYRDFFTDEEGKTILEKCYRFINTFPIEAIVVLIDTHELIRKYSMPDNPYYLAYEVLCEKVQKIVKKRNDQDNNFAIINIAKVSTNLANQLTKLHTEFKEKGSKFAKWDNIFPIINVEDDEKSIMYDIADLICYAYRRSYYAWLCQNLNRMSITDDYLSLIDKICTLKIGHILINKKVYVKVIPEPRFIKYKTEETK